MLLSGPRVRPSRPWLETEAVLNTLIEPFGVIKPILLARPVENQTLPSPPTVRLPGKLVPPGRWKA